MIAARSERPDRAAEPLPTLSLTAVPQTQARASYYSDGSNRRRSPGASQPKALAPCRTQS